VGRLIWKLVFATTVMVVLATWCVRTIRDRMATLERATDQLQAMTLLLEQHADRAFDTGDKVVQAIIELAGSNRFDDAADAERLHRQMRRLVAGSPQIGATWILDPTGRHIAESWAYPTSATSNFAFREYFQAHQKGETGLHIGTFDVGGAERRPRFTLSRPILRPDGSFGGVAVVAVLGSISRRCIDWPILGQVDTCAWSPHPVRFWPSGRRGTTWRMWQPRRWQN
jgi:two-component system, sensor histidine kinase